MQISALSLSDKDSVERTFDVQVKNGLTAEWVYRDGSSLAEMPKVKATIRPATASVARKSSNLITVPYTITNADGTTTVKYVSKHVTSIIPSDAPADAIANLEAYAGDSFTETQLNEIVTLGAFPY